MATAPVDPSAIDYLRGPCFSPDGRFVYFPERATIKVLDLQQQAIEGDGDAVGLPALTTPHGSVVLSCAASPTEPIVAAACVAGIVSLFGPQF